MELAMKKSCRAQLSKTVNEANDLLNAESFDARESAVQVAKIKSARENLNNANEKAAKFIPCDQIEHECEKIVEYDEKAVVAIARLEQKIAEAHQMADNLALGASASNILHNSRDGSNPERQQSVAESVYAVNQGKMSVRLPKLDLIKFSGDYHEWPAFWEQFDTAINSNDSLDETAKFSYLKSVLLDNAAVTIQGLTSSKTSYKNAIQLLKDEYGNKDRIIDSYIQKLLSLNTIKNRNDVDSLRKLYNTASKITKSLDTLGIEPNSYGMMVKSIILKVLPFSMRIEFKKKQAIHEVDNDNEKSLSGSVKSGGSNVSNSTNKPNDRPNKYKNKTHNFHREDTFKGDEFTAAGLYTAVREQCLFCESNEHLTINCKNVSLSLEQKKNILKSSARCFRCTKINQNSRHCKTVIQCVKCKGKHATTMCEPEYAKNKNSNRAQNERDQGTINLFANGSLDNVYLQTAYAEIVKDSSLDTDMTKLFVRLVIDGGSQLTFIKECISKQLGLPVVGTHKISIMSFGKNEGSPARVCRRVRLTLKSCNDNDVITINAIEVPEICFDSMPPPSNNNPAIREFSAKNKLADKCPMNAKIIPGISLLIGADYYWKVVTGEIKKLSDSQMAVNTRLCWTIHGVTNEYGFSLNVNVANILHVQGGINNDESINIKRFWDLEAIGIQGIEYVLKNNTSNFVNENIVFKNNRYCVSLPWTNSSVTLDSNFTGAMFRVKVLTSKLIRTEKLQEYDRAVREYFYSDCAEQVPYEAGENRTYYMPHRPVYREDKDTTKIRVVFDASAHAFGMPSLNDLLTSGENLVPLLLKVLLNFRIGSIALTADVEKAFLQIEVNENDRNAQSFLWYDSPIEDVTVLPKIVRFRMKRVTFGVTCSPFILAATLQKHLTEQPQHVKDVCDTMLRSFYVDDLIVSLSSVEDAQRIYAQGKQVMSNASMNLRKWTTNNVELKRFIDRDYSDNDGTCMPNVTKVLGLSWYTKTDELLIDVKPVLEIGQGVPVTKRKILQTVAKVYDPLGLLSPFIIRAKILLQQIWIKKYDWDSLLSEDLLTIWIKWFTELHDLSEFYIPRCVMKNSEDYVELHIFSDASPQAYGAVAYLRVLEESKIMKCNILMAKNRVAPISEKGDKELTLPKLELTGALCAVRLQHFIISNLHIRLKSCFLWTDSKITLYWINGKAARWKPYVCHRVTEIQKLAVREWRHCPGADNPADVLTRGVKVKSLLESKIWQHGPEWLINDKKEWPKEELTVPEASLISIFSVHAEIKENNESLFPIENYSNYEKILRITSYVFRFIRKVQGSQNDISTNYVTAKEMIESERYWIKTTQKQHFQNEVTALTNGKPVENQSSILTLNPFLDEHEIMRLGGRLQESLLAYETKHSILLPKKSILTDHIILNSHIVTSHGGVNITLTQVRRRYWIIQARQRVKTVLKTCMKCKRLRAKSATEPFAPLLRSRLDAVSPFKATGVDFAGPLFVLTDNGKKKVYIMLLTCTVTRAVHLEAVPDMTTESCIRALRRFISRRGVPNIIYSDNAKTFKRTAMELRELSKILYSTEVQNLANEQRIEWKFIVERASWWGGFWERLVHSVKDALKLTLGRKLINFDELYTTLTEAEATINSRPLTYVHNDPDDLMILTPAHFLLGEKSCGFMVDTNHSEVRRSDILKKWKVRNNMLSKFWNRWSTTYLQQLRNAHSNIKVNVKSLKVGDIVLLHDQSLPRLIWKIVRVTKTFMGRDGKVRACEVVTSNRTVLRRPIQLLYPLELTAAGEDVENSQVKHDNVEPGSPTVPEEPVTEGTER